MDNCATHHFAGGEALQEWLNERNIELVYTPTYSPDFNPAESVFNKMRSVVRYHLWDLTNENIELAAYEAAHYQTKIKEESYPNVVVQVYLMKVSRSSSGFHKISLN